MLRYRASETCIMLVKYQDSECNTDKKDSLAGG